ncbi:MerR family transcriptional regulator [Streptomyces sp. 4N509B]|uniref:MerR family transcriptional regulator n=1 Tax=Streptomyces sp. 4N509B TaxID=3457413 RepID=UPI003FD0BB5A
MRIGELAALVGVSTRTVRHYHRIGLLPEPARLANGYRVYGLRDAVTLTRVRRLTELGLSLDEIRDVTAHDAGLDLVEVLTELDADLARQEDAIRARRARLAELLTQAKERGGLPAEGPVSPELAAFFHEMADTAAGLPGPEPAMAAKERELLALLESSSATSGASDEWLKGLLAAADAGPEGMRHAYEIYARLDDLATAPTDDPRVAEVARAIADATPEELVRGMADAEDGDSENEGEGAAAEWPDSGFARAFFADFAPAQAEAIRQSIELLRGRAR